MAQAFRIYRQTAKNLITRTSRQNISHQYEWYQVTAAVDTVCVLLFGIIFNGFTMLPNKVIVNPSSLKVRPPQTRYAHNAPNLPLDHCVSQKWLNAPTQQDEPAQNSFFPRYFSFSPQTWLRSPPSLCCICCGSPGNVVSYRIGRAHTETMTWSSIFFLLLCSLRLSASHVGSSSTLIGYRG